MIDDYILDIKNTLDYIMFNYKREDQRRAEEIFLTLDYIMFNYKPLLKYCVHDIYEL